MPVSEEDLSASHSPGELRFSAANLLRPRESEGFDAYHAPLIIQELGSRASDSSYFGTFGTVTHSPAGKSVLVREKPAVYYLRTSGTFDVHVHRQLSYVWFYFLESSGAPAGGPAVQGFRQTLDRSGYPAVTEILWSPDGLRLIYVSRSLENAAVREFGGALPGRRYAVERALEDQPGVVVAGVIEDGPEPMGPLVYLRAGTGEVGALACRCMPSRVEEILEIREYQLLPLETLQQTDLGPLVDLRIFDLPTDSNVAGGEDLAQTLRLPSDF